VFGTNEENYPRRDETHRHQTEGNKEEEKVNVVVKPDRGANEGTVVIKHEDTSSCHPAVF
jgi:hypothetical protein